MHGQQNIKKWSFLYFVKCIQFSLTKKKKMSFACVTVLTFLSLLLHLPVNNPRYTLDRMWASLRASMSAVEKSEFFLRMKNRLSTPRPSHYAVWAIFSPSDKRRVVLKCRGQKCSH